MEHGHVLSFQADGTGKCSVPEAAGWGRVESGGRIGGQRRGAVTTQPWGQRDPDLLWKAHSAGGMEKPDLENEPRGKGVRIWEVF